MHKGSFAPIPCYVFGLLFANWNITFTALRWAVFHRLALRVVLPAVASTKVDLKHKKKLK